MRLIDFSLEEQKIQDQRRRDIEKARAELAYQRAHPLPCPCKNCGETVDYSGPDASYVHTNPPRYFCNKEHPEHGVATPEWRA